MAPNSHAAAFYASLATEYGFAADVPLYAILDRLIEDGRYWEVLVTRLCAATMEEMRTVRFNPSVVLKEDGEVKAIKFYELDGQIAISLYNYPLWFLEYFYHFRLRGWRNRLTNNPPAVDWERYWHLPIV